MIPSIKKTLFLLSILSLCAEAKMYNISGIQAEKLTHLLLSGGVLAKNVTENLQNSNIIEAIEIKAGNTICHGSRWIYTDDGNATDTFPDLGPTKGCAFNSPLETGLNDDQTPFGTPLKADLVDILRTVKQGVYSDGAMGKFDVGLANLTCSAVAKHVNDKVVKSVVCTYSDWE